MSISPGNWRGRWTGRGFWRYPALPLKAVLGDFASVVLSSQRAVPKALLDSGFRFSFPTLDMALDDLIAQPVRA